MKPSLLIALLVLLASPVVASETVVSGPLVATTPEDYSDVSDGRDLMRGSFYNPSGIVIDDTLHIFITGDLWGEAEADGWTACEHGDQTVHFTTTDISDDLTPVELASPCCGNEGTLDTHYGLGSVSRPPWGDDYMIFMERTEDGAAFGEGDFKDVLVGLSDDATGWTFPGYSTGTCNDAGPPINPLIKQNCYDNGKGEICVSILDVNLVSNGQDRLWGVFRFGTASSNKVGRMQMLEDAANPRGFVVQILSTSGWHTVADDGSFQLEEGEIENIWPFARVNSIYDSGSGFELWGWNYNLSGVEEGCDDPRGGGSTLVYRSITETTLGPVQEVHSAVDGFPIPSRGNQSRIYPYRVDFNGDELIFMTSASRVCETLGLTSEPWWPGGWAGGFRGMEILVASLNNPISSSDCDPFADVLCLHDDRFKVELTGADPAAEPGIVMPFGDQSAGFRFADPDRVEATVKIVDGTGSNDHWWVFHGALSYGYLLKVTDTTNGSYREYQPAVPFAATDLCGGADLGAFYQPWWLAPSDLAPAPLKAEPGAGPDGWHRAFPDAADPEAAELAAIVGCSGGSDRLCLLDRFQVEVFKDNVAQRALAWTGASGVFSFGDDQLIEIPVKMVHVGDFFWFYYGSMTNSAYTVRVTDTWGSDIREYSGDAPFCGRYDLDSF